MTENLNTDAIRQLLNRSLAQIEQPALASLKNAREQALLRHAPNGANSLWKSSKKRHAAVAWAVTLLLIVSLFGGVTYYWQQTNDNSDIDLAILTDDMPVDVYVN